MIATITLENIELYAFHGCFEVEQLVGNRFRVDLTVKYDATKAAQSDHIGDAINYVSLYECVRENMMQASHLLEHVAKRVLDDLGTKFAQAEYAEIKIAKLAPPLGGQLQSVSVSASRIYAEC